MLKFNQIFERTINKGSRKGLPVHWRYLSIPTNKEILQLLEFRVRSLHPKSFTEISDKNYF